MRNISFDDFLQIVSEKQPKQATHFQLSRSLDMDCANPMAILLALQQQPQFFLLESATRERTIGRYSFFAYQMERRFCAMPNDSLRLWCNDYQTQGSKSQQPKAAVRLDGNPFEQLFACSLNPKADKKIEVLRPSTHIWEGFQGGLVGMFSYEAVRHMGVLREDLCQLSVPDSLYGAQPELLFYEVQRFFVIDNATQRMFAVYLLPLPQNSASLARAYQHGQETLNEMATDLQAKLNRVQPGEMLPPHPLQESHPTLGSQPSQGSQGSQPSQGGLWQEDQTEQQQRWAIEQLRGELERGEALQVVYSVGRQGPPVSPSLFYRLLRRQNPSPYMFFFKDGKNHLVGSSPEIHLRYQGGIACIKPLAGTRPLREGIGKEEYEQLVDELLRDPKERAEHLMLIDLARNDLYTHCDSVHTVKKFIPERFSHVVHIASEVQGHLKEGSKPYKLFARTFPAGTLSGAPKVRAIELIDQYEHSPRSYYGGCIGYFNYDGSFDSAIIIRSAWLDGQKTLARSGCGLVYDSEPAYEIHEHRRKLAALSAVLETCLASRKTV